MRFLDALNLSHANDKDQPVAATDVPMCAQPFGNSAASYCYVAIDLPNWVQQRSRDNCAAAISFLRRHT